MSGEVRVVDLTRRVEDAMPVPAVLPRIALGAGDTGTVENVFMPIHVGTHVDAPAHFVNGAATIDQLDPLALCGSAVVVDTPSDGTWREVAPTVFEDWEAGTGERIGAGDIVLLRTGHGRLWSDPVAFLTTPWPHLGSAAAGWLVERGIRALGVESSDPDRYDANAPAESTFPTHERLLRAGVLIVENLANLDQIDVTRFEFRALGLPIAAASGSPIRALALFSSRD